MTTLTSYVHGAAAALALLSLPPVAAFASPAAMPVATVDSVAEWGLPVMCIETVGHEEPRCDYVGPPAGCIGAGITNATKVPARMVLYGSGSGDTLYDSGEYVDDHSGLTVKIRGNTSAYSAKKPYKLKLQKKADLLLRGDDERYRDKNWLLIRDDDLTGLMGFTVSELIGTAWTPGFCYVNVVLNGDYRGVYMLVEQVKRNTRCRLDCEPDGFVVELDPYWWNEPLSIKAPAFKSTYRYTFKYPEWDDVDDDRLARVTEVMNAFDRSITDGTYPEQADVESFAQWILGHDILGTWDSGGSNKYLLKRDDTPATKLEMPVMWDFDSSMQTAGKWGRLHTDIFRKFFASDNKELIKAFQHRWLCLSPWIADSVKSRLKAFAKSDQGKGYAATRPHDNARWGVTYPTLAKCRKAINQWMADRVPWLDSHVPELYTNPFAPTDINEDGITDVDDLNRLVNVLLHKQPRDYHADVNHDAMVDIGDVNDVVNGIARKGSE